MESRSGPAGATRYRDIGDVREADLCVRIDITTWRRLNAGEISAPEAMLRRQVKLDGDFLLGLKLHLILG